MKYVNEQNGSDITTLAEFATVEEAQLHIKKIRWFDPSLFVSDKPGHKWKGENNEST